MLKFSTQGVTSRTRIGFPTKDGGFAGIASDTSVSIGAIVLGGVIAVAIVWLATRTKEPQEPEAIDAPTKLAVTRTAASSN
jgi:hypothetical protein